MTCIHGNKVNRISEYNLLHDILNPSKKTKILNSLYSPEFKVLRDYGFWYGKSRPTKDRGNEP